MSATDGGLAGEFVLILGPMFAGKSSELIRYTETHEAVGFRVLAINHSFDTRYAPNGGALVTHSAHSREAVSVCSFAEIPTDLLNDADLIVGDEVQFFADALVFVEKWRHEKKIVLAGLSGDANLKPFSVISELVPLATTIVHLKAICLKCKIRDAPYTTSISRSTDQVQVGGPEMYSPSCQQCHHNTKATM